MEDKIKIISLNTGQHFKADPNIDYLKQIAQQEGIPIDLIKDSSIQEENQCLNDECKILIKIR